MRCVLVESCWAVSMLHPVSESWQIRTLDVPLFWARERGSPSAEPDHYARSRDLSAPAGPDRHRPLDKHSPERLIGHPQVPTQVVQRPPVPAEAVRLINLRVGHEWPRLARTGNVSGDHRGMKGRRPSPTPRQHQHRTANSSARQRQLRPEHQRGRRARIPLRHPC